jgi:hypothetical protein
MSCRAATQAGALDSLQAWKIGLSSFWQTPPLTHTMRDCATACRQLGGATLGPRCAYFETPAWATLNSIAARTPETTDCEVSISSPAREYREVL